MRYRRFGKLNYQASVLGFGTMRLPVIGGDSAKVDEEQAIALIRYAIDHGVNYVDSAHGYHGGTSEVVTGKALAGGCTGSQQPTEAARGTYRERVKIATKMPCWAVETADSFDRLFDEQLKRLQTGTIDFYLLHCLSNKFWDKLRGFGVLQWAERMIARGRIGGFGFSCHEDFADFRRYLDDYDGWTMCQIQYNYLDQNNQAGTRGLDYATSKGLPVVVMEPLRGGRLAAEPPPAVRAVWDTAPASSADATLDSRDRSVPPTRRTPADRALQWVWNHPQVAVALSGMNSMQQVQENLASAERAAADALTPEELALYDRVVAAYREASPVPCTACGYCMPCPNGVNIPRVFEIYNESAFYADLGVPKYTYARMGEGERADKCGKCGACEEKCPQKIGIMNALAEAHGKLKG